MKDIGTSKLSLPSSALAKAIVWGRPPVSGIFVAAFTDSLTLNESELMHGLSERERDRAHNITDPVEKRHFVIRRCFQRAFVKTVLNWEDGLESLCIEHQLDTQPQCLDAPALRLSFSSSGQTAIACASMQYRVGVDIEKLRSITNAAALAQRFFTLKEVASIRSLPIADQNVAFLKHWTAKEAGLKAIGKGIEFGLNSFTLTQKNSTYLIENNVKCELQTSWLLNHMTFLPEHIVAVVHSLEK